MNSVFVDSVYIGKAKNLKASLAGGIDQGQVASGGEV
jgi:hypothetical protein|tara:strand:- start:450 stop:560 length:111 start_codon:yes stop_codon:yes gene_type:complete